MNHKNRKVSENGKDIDHVRNPHASPKGEILRKACPYMLMTAATKDTPTQHMCSRSKTILDGKEHGYNCYHCTHFPIS